MELRNVYNYVINLTHLKHSDLWDKNVILEHDEHEKDELLQFSVTRSNGCCLQFRVQSVRLQLDFFHFSREGKHHLVSFSAWINIMLKSFSCLCQFHLGEVFFFLCHCHQTSRVIYKQRFPLPQHVRGYRCCETQICVINRQV